MSHEAFYRQPFPGNLQEEKALTFQFPQNVLGDRKLLFEKLLMCYQSGPVMLPVKIASCDKDCLVDVQKP